MARPVYAVVQVSALSVGLLALVLLVLLRTDLISSWRKATPVNAPDRFVINVQPDQTQAFQAALQASGVTTYDWYPMIRGRLITVNGQSVNSEAYESDRAKRLVDLGCHRVIQRGAIRESQRPAGSLDERHA